MDLKIKQFLIKMFIISLMLYLTLAYTLVAIKTWQFSRHLRSVIQEIDTKN